MFSLPPVSAAPASLYRRDAGAVDFPDTGCEREIDSHMKLHSDLCVCAFQLQSRKTVAMKKKIANENSAFTSMMDIGVFAHACAGT